MPVSLQKPCTELLWLTHPGSEEKDIQILVDIKLNISQQCTLASNKASSILEWVRRIVASRLKIIFPLCLGVSEGTMSIFGKFSTREECIFLDMESKGGPLRW